MERLRTFRSSTWFAKPPGASAVTCALHGYQNSGIDIVSCTGCRAKLACIVPPSSTAADLKVIGDKFRARLTEAHDAACPWRTQTCDPTLAQFPPELSEKVAEDFARRSEALKGLLMRLGRRPRIASRLLDSSGSRAQLAHVTGETEGWGTEGSLAKLLAVTGWEPHVRIYLVDSCFA